MKNLVIIFLVFNLNFAILAQTDCKHPVLILPLAKNTTIKVNNENVLLSKAFTCDKQALIEILSGRVSLLTSNGDEIIYETGGKINIAKANNVKETFPLNKVSKYLEQPSVYLPNLYNSSRSDFVIFPLESHVIDKSSIKFYFTDDINGNASFKICEKDTDSIVWQTKHFIEDFDPEKIPFEQGKLYTWKVYNGSNSLKGKIHFLAENEANKLNLNTLDQVNDYIAAYLTLLENHCIFDAVATLLEGVEKYPESETLLLLLEKLPDEVK